MPDAPDQRAPLAAICRHGDRRARYFEHTRAAALWDDEHLHIGFWIEEPFPEARVTARDGIVFAENDVELFIDGGDCYYELEIDAANTVYEVSSSGRTLYTRGGRFDVPEFDLVERRALSFAGDDDRQVHSFWQGTHPRGPRWASRDWDLPGLRTAVHVDGALNDRRISSASGWQRGTGPAVEQAGLAGQRA